MLENKKTGHMLENCTNTNRALLKKGEKLDNVANNYTDTMGFYRMNIRITDTFYRASCSSPVQHELLERFHRPAS